MDYRDHVQGMKPAEAVDYLLNVIDVLVTPVADRPRPSDALGLDLTQIERRILDTLMARPGQCIIHEQVLRAVYFDRPDWDNVSLGSIKVMISRLRRKLPASVGTIRCVWKRGYVFDAGGSGDRG